MAICATKELLLHAVQVVASQNACKTIALCDKAFGGRKPLVHIYLPLMFYLLYL